MKQLQPVIWAKGTFLTPQHLQAQDRFLGDSLAFRLDALNFRPWGFRTLNIDREALAAGNFVITEASGILPDGLPFDVPGSDSPPPPKNLADYLQGDEKSVDVYMAIPPLVDGGVNVSMANGNADARYLSEIMPLRDENSGLSEKPVQVARKNLRILLATEAQEGTTAMPVARVERTEGGLLRVDPQFVPALLDIQASDYLMSILRRLLEILVAKSGSLAGLRRQKNVSLADFTAADIANFWLLYAVNSHLPLFRHILETRKGHPEALFQVMTSLAGTLTTFSQKIQPRDLPQYNHERLGECFTDLDNKLRTLLETVVPSNVVSLALKLVQPFIYAAAIDEEKYLSNTRLYLAVKSALPEGELISRIPQLVKVCSATHIEHLIRQALPGVPLLHVPNPPNSIPIRLDHQYFSLSQSGGAWESVLRARNFAVYVPAEFPDPVLELVILLPQSS